MSREESTVSGRKFYQVLNGSFRTRVPETHPEAEARINKKGVQVFEKEVQAVFGTIENVELVDGTFGKQLLITLDKNEDGENPVLSFIAESKDGRDILKKLPAVDFSKEVRISPYRFTPEGKTEEVSGIAISHADEDGQFTQKVGNFFFDVDKKEFTNGYPTIDWDNSSESDQKIYKIQRDSFLVDYLKEHVLPKFAGYSQEKPRIEYPNGLTEEEIAAIPF